MIFRRSAREERLWGGAGSTVEPLWLDSGGVVCGKSREGSWPEDGLGLHRPQMRYVSVLGELLLSALAGEQAAWWTVVP